MPEFFGERFPDALERADTTPPVMFPVFGGPLLVALGALHGPAPRCAARAPRSRSGRRPTMAEIGSRSTVDGANDNLSGVAALLGLARTLRERPPKGLRVLLVSTGSEESFMEGMQAFARAPLRARCRARARRSSCSTRSARRS